MGSSVLNEIGLESQYYSRTGGVIDDPFWSNLEKIRDRNPVEFDGKHPNFGPFFAPPAVLGTLPETPLLDNLRGRYETDAARFSHWHPRVAPLLARERLVAQYPPFPPPVPPDDSPLPPGHAHPPPPPPTPECGSVPEPSGMALALIAVAVLAAFRRCGLFGRS